MIFRNSKRTRRDRKQASQQRETRRRRLANLMTRAPQVESLEDRRLLAVFSNPASITINDDAAATPYPSSINVAGLTGNVVDVNVTIEDFNHTFPDDVAIVLVGPSGANTLLTANNGGSDDISNVDLTFDDLAVSTLPDDSQITSGTYQPTLGTGFPAAVALPAPGPAGPYGADLSVFNGSAANGTWELYVFDDDIGDTGSIASGWSLDIITTNPVFTGTSSGNDFELRINPADDTLLDVVIDGNTTSFPIAAIAALTISGGDGDDSLTVDYTNGDPIPAGGLTFNGQGQATADGDSLSIVNPVAFGTQILTSTTTSGDGNDGNIQIDSGPLITYTGLEPINAGNAADTILNLPTGFANDATLQDSAGAGQIEIIDNGATFEDTIIPNPTNSLTVNLGDDDDQLLVNTLDDDYAASLIINGGAGTDDVELDDVDLIDTPGRGLLVTETETLDITGGTISGNTAINGGGILIEDAGTTATIDGTTITGNTATGATGTQGGGGIFNNGANLTIEGGAQITNNVANGTAGSGGGIFNALGGVLTVDSSTISGNQAERAGGGIEDASGASVSLDNVNLDNNLANGTNAPGNGGGLHVTGAATVDIVGGTVNGNSAAREGGGLWNGAGIMTIDDVTIDGNTASGDATDEGGGGIFNNGGTLTIGATSAVDITNNVADGTSGNGGGIMSVGGSVSVTGGTIQTNQATRAGGGIENNGGSIALNRVNINGNTAGINGGGLHISGAGDVIVNNGNFTGNVAVNEGGGLWNSAAGTIDINGTRIDGNNADFGGGVFNDGTAGDISIDGASITGNSANINGGGVNSEGGTVTIFNLTNISGNSASGDAADQGGGGIFSSGGTVDIDNVTINANSADGAAGSGGGILNLGGSITIDNALIDANVASRAGGGIEDRDGTLVEITDSRIRNNNAGSSPGNGGGIHITGTGTVNIDGSTIDGNTAVEGGGLWNSGSGTYTITNTTISGNSASGSDGGGIFNTDGGLVRTDSVTITLNDASTGIGSGVAGGLGGGVTLENTIVAQNPGGGIEENLSGEINSADFNLIGDGDVGTLTGLTANTIFGGVALLLPLANNGGPTPTHLPGSGSPAIGFGNTNLGDDQRDILRPQGAQDDIGAVEVDLRGEIVFADDLAAGTAGDGNPDEFIIRNDGGGLAGNVEVLINSHLVHTFPKATTGLILIRGSADDDTLIVDNSNGLIGSKIIFDGDGGPRNSVTPSPGGFDTLILDSSGLVTTTPVTTTYNPGETADAGAVLHENNQIVQRIEFFGLEPIQVLAPVAGNNILNVASAPLGIGFPQALNATNSINYTEGPNSNDPADVVFAGALTGLITVDGFESLEFANFEVMNISAGAGSDEINLNNPVTPNELETITVDGGDPTATSDVVVVNGTAGTDTVTIDQLTFDGATVNGLGPVITVTTSEQLVYHSQGGADDLIVETPAGLHQIALQPEANPTNGELVISDPMNNSLLGIRFENLDVATVDSSLTLRDAGADGSDDLVYVGTDGVDVFAVNADGRVTLQETQTVQSANKFVVVETPGIRNLTLNGLGGDDTFNIVGDHPFVSMLVEGGTPSSGSDVLDFVGSSAGPVALSLTNQSVTENNPVNFSGVETVNIDANNTLTVNGTANADVINVTPVNAGNGGSFDHNGSPGVAFNYSDATTITFNGSVGVDELNVLGDANVDVVTSAAGEITVDGSTVTLGTSIEAIQVLGLGGDDNINLADLGAAVTVRGGDGDDVIVGTDQPDLIFGGAGNDNLTGGDGDDQIYGESGNDTIGGDAAGSDDGGNDFFSGGDGSDLFIWEPGDAQDVIAGGDDGDDVFEFRGRGQAGDVFVLSADGGGVDATFNAATINLAGVEDIQVAPGDGGAADVTVGDLFGTEVTNVDVQLPAAGTTDTVDVDGRQVADDLNVHVSGLSVAVSGLTYAVSVAGGVVGEDTLNVNTFGGDDSVEVSQGVQVAINTALFGGSGDDTFSGFFNQAEGGSGNDTFLGENIDQRMDGGDGDDVFVGGGGTNTIVGGAGIGDVILVEGTPGDDDIDVTLNAALDLVVTVNGLTTIYANATADLEGISIVSGAGEDVVTVDVNNGAIPLPIDYDGGTNSDALEVTGTAAAIDTVVYSVGPAVDEGQVRYLDAAGDTVMSIDFRNLEPFDDDVAAANLVVNATNADNAINYSQGLGGGIFVGDTGLISIDGFEVIQFNNKTNLTINGGAGDDTIHLNNPVAPAGLTGNVSVDGGDPTASDTVIVNGTTAADNIAVDQISIDGATVTGAQAVPVVITTTENLVINGQGGVDSLTVTTPSGAEQIEYTPGTLPDSGSIVLQDLSAGPERLLGISFQDLGQIGSSVTFADVDGTPVDDLFVVGTVHNDLFDVTNAGVVTITDISGVGITPSINTPGVDQLTLQGLSGDDTFEIPGDHTFSELPIGIYVSGGNPGSGSDVLNFTGAGADVTIDIAAATITEAGFAAVNFSGIETLNADVNGALTVEGTDADDLIDVTPTADGDDGTFRHSGASGVLFNYTDATSATFDGDNDVGDVLTVIGDASANTIVVTGVDIDVDNSTVTVGDGIESVVIRSLGGDDNVDLTASTIVVPTTVDAGAGDDTVTGTTRNADNTVAAATATPLVLLGGSGNDTLIGGSGGDVLNGGDGDDVLEGAQGADQFFGGDGSDLLRWIAGDGSDLMEGGAGETDQLIFIANDASNLLQLYGGGLSTDNPAGIFPPQTLENSTRAIFELNAGQVFLNTGDVESVSIDARDGDDNIVINNQVDAVSRGDSPVGGGVAISQGTDLAPTAVQSVEVLDGLGDDYIDVHGTATDDNIDVAVQGGATVIEGASVFVEIRGVGGADTLHVHGQTGNDNIKAADGTEATIAITLEGDAGDDFLSADAILIGGAGDDFLQGGAGDDTLIGNAGEDTFVGGAGNDTIDGGPDFDTILIAGTSGADIIDVNQVSPTQLDHTVNGDAQSDTLVVSTVEQALVEAGDGADLVRVNWQDALGVNAAVDSLRMTVNGGSDATSDRLIVVDDGTDDLVLYRKGQDNDSGTVQIGPGNAEPLLNVFSDVENIDVVDENGAPVVNAAGGPQLVVFKHDPFESNDDRFTATYLGSGDTINVDPTIDPGPLANPFGDGQNFGGDSDFYRVVAETTGTLDFQVYFRQVPALASGRPGLPNDGNLDINVLDAAGNIIAGFGVNDADDDERVRIPAVEGQTYFLQVFGNGGNAINIYNFTVVNHAPPVPFDLELLDNPADGTTNPPGGSSNSDTGRSQFDNHTYDDTPTLYFRLDDGIFLNDLPGNPATDTPPDEIIPIPFQPGVAQPNTPGYAIAIFDEGNTPPQTGTAVQTPLGFATAVAGQQGIYTFTVPAALALSEGSHFLSARVQMIDPANPQQTGFGARSDSLEIVVDRTPPAVAFGLAAVVGDGLHPDSDSGDPALPLTLVDRITNDETPTFFGRAEANAIVRAYVDLDDSGTLTAADLLIGQTVATPLDGTEQLETPANPLEPGGQWQITSTVNMNDPRILTALGLAKDGSRRILISAEDVAGNITAPDANEILEIFVDTQGPQVTGVFITDVPAFNIFTLKPETPQPTPRVDSLTISVQDLPPRVAAFLYSAVSNVPPLAPIVLVGDHSGPIAISNLAYNALNNGPGIATGAIVMDFASPLPDDRYTLTIQDSVIDPAGNRLDGENNAAEPIGNPFFPTGDAIPGGDFIARFTVDSRPEVATWSQGAVYADINGNFVWDPEGEDNDATNRDFVYNFGEITDAYFTGNFSQNDNSSGFDKLGAYGRFNGVYQFFLDTDDDGVGDLVPNMAFQVNAIPVAGNFFNSAGDIAAVAAGQRPRDEIGAYDGTTWYLDTNGNNQIDAGESFATNLRGIPFVGDFNGDGFDDLATFNNDTGVFQFDLNRDGNVNDTITFGFPGFGEKPVAGDFNLDGIDDIGLWVPGQEGQLPKDAGEFHFLLSDRDPIGVPQAAPVIGTGPSVIFDPFSPAPLGNDLIAQFGDDFALPLFGNFDPPITPDGGGATFVGSLTNELNPLDTTVDGKVTARDSLVVINALGREGLNQTANPLRVVASLGGLRLDANEDGIISSLDALKVINGLAQLSNASAEAESIAWAASADNAIAGLDDDDDDDLLSLLASDQEQQRIKS